MIRLVDTSPDNRRPLMSPLNRRGTPRIRNRNTYTDEDKAKALLVLFMVNGRSKTAARITGIPIMTINDWKYRRHGITDEVEQMAKHFGAELNEAFEKILRASIEQIIEDLLNGELTAKERSWLLINGVDKWLLLNGQANQIVGTDITADEKRAQILDLAKRLSGNSE